MIFFPYAHSTGGNALVVRSVKLKVLLPYRVCVSLTRALCLLQWELKPTAVVTSQTT